MFKRRFALLLAVLAVALSPDGAGAQTTTTAMIHGIVTCANTATTVISTFANPTAGVLILENNGGGAAIFVGNGVPNALTTANGFPIANGAALTLENYRGIIQCIVAAGTLELRYIQLAK